nr:cbb3-type cytochrome c oxidase subunit I [uncultured Allomuricauda sp.]
MNKIYKKPYLAFFSSIPIILLYGMLSGDATLDINIHDTYYVIANLHLAVLISFVFGIIGGGYWITQRVGGKLSTWLSAIHIFVTIGGLLVIFLLPLFTFSSYSESSFPAYDDLVIKNLVLVCVLFSIALGQLLYLINLVLALIQKKK